MSDIEEFAKKLNEQEPIDFDSLKEAFDQIFYDNPEGSNPVEAKHVKGLSIRSVGDVDSLVKKLEVAKEAEPKFIQIGKREYHFDSNRSLANLINGIRIGQSTDD